MILVAVWGTRTRGGRTARATTIAGLHHRSIEPHSAVGSAAAGGEGEAAEGEQREAARLGHQRHRQRRAGTEEVFARDGAAVEVEVEGRAVGEQAGERDVAAIGDDEGFVEHEAGQLDAVEEEGRAEQVDRAAGAGGEDVADGAAGEVDRATGECLEEIADGAAGEVDRAAGGGVEVAADGAAGDVDRAAGEGVKAGADRAAGDVDLDIRSGAVDRTRVEGAANGAANGAAVREVELGVGADAAGDGGLVLGDIDDGVKPGGVGLGGGGGGHARGEGERGGEARGGGAGVAGGTDHLVSLGGEWDRKRGQVPFSRRGV